MASRAEEIRCKAESHMINMMTRTLNDVYSGPLCHSFVLHQILGMHYGYIVSGYLDKFRTLYAYMAHHNIGSENPIRLGDNDYSAWHESSSDGERRVIIVVCHVRLTDNNIHIFIDESDQFNDRFHLRLCYPKSRRSNHRREGWYSVERASIAFYRKMDFRIQFGDSRDHGYCGSYLRRKLDAVTTHMVDDAHHVLTNIDVSLDTLELVHQGVQP